MSGSTSIVDPHGTWTANTDGSFNFKLSGPEGNSTLDLKTSDGKVVGNATVSGVNVGTKENHLTVGGGSQSATWKGSLSYGKTTVNVLGRSSDLGDGRTEDFQLTFTVKPTPLGPQWTGVATKDSGNLFYFGHAAGQPNSHQKASITIIEQKDPIFDQAGIVLPFAKFTGWATHFKFELKTEGGVEAENSTLMVTRTLEVELRPIFTPFPDVKWPKKPPRPPFLEPFSNGVAEKTLKYMQLQTLLRFVGESLEEVNKWKKLLELMATVDKITTAVAVATAALAAAAGVAAAFLELNPIADAAESAAAWYLATEMAELAVSKSAVAAARKLLAWTVERLTAAVILSLAAGRLAQFAAEAAAPGSLVDKSQVAAGAKAQFDVLAKQSGLDAAGDDLDAISKSLTNMQKVLISHKDAASQELKMATDALAAAAARANNLLMYQILLESWTSDPAHAPFLTWPGSNLGINSPSENVETMDLGDISTREKLTAAVVRMEDYAKTKRYTGFVVNKALKKAFFRNKDVATLLTTVVQGDDTKGLVSYVRAEKLTLTLLVDRWQVIAKAQEA